jgi:hypothetical protein
MASVLDVDGVANAAVVTVTGGTAGKYKAALTFPALTAGQTIRLRATYIMQGIATSQDIIPFATADTKIISDLQDAGSSQGEAAAAANDLQTFLGTPAQAGEAAAASSQGEAAAASSQGEAAAAQAAIIEHVDAIEVDLLHTEDFNLVGAAFLEAIEAADYATGTDISELLSSIPDVVLTDILIYPENKLLTDENGFVVSLHGDGTSKCTIPIQTAEDIGISGACIRIATDNIGANIIDVQYTDSFGYASFYLQVGKTYYYRVTSSSYQSAGWTSFVAVAD